MRKLTSLTVLLAVGMFMLVGCGTSTEHTVQKPVIEEGNTGDLSLEESAEPLDAAGSDLDDAASDLDDAGSEESDDAAGQ